MAETQTEEKAEPVTGLDRYFRISQRGSSIGREFRGGLTTFFTMAYIVVLNPIILGTVPDKDGNFIGGSPDGPNYVAVAAATALVAGIMTILMGSVARFPIAIAAGLGLNAYVTFGLVGGGLFTWPEAMGLIIIEGAIVLILVLTKLRIKFLYAVPMALKKAIAAGIGLFLAYIAFWDSRLVLDDGSGATPGSFGMGGGFNSWPSVVFVVGILLGAILLVKKVHGALLITIIVGTVLAFIVEAVANLGSVVDNPRGWSLVVPSFDGKSWDLVPDFSLLGQFSITGPFTHGPAIITVLLIIFSLLVVDFFDTMGTMTAVGEEAELNDEDGIPEDSQAILVVDSVAAMAGGAASVSSNTSYIESASGVGDGARTGIASIVTGLAFLVAVFLAPLAQIVPFEAATPVLVLVGLMMLRSAVDLDWRDYRIAVPAFLTIIVMPFGYSISAGIGLGFVSYVVINAFTGKIKEIKPLMWVGAAAFIVYFSMVGIDTLIN
jgi:AGZA family xanthine/uracil permease-like MFS transporter